MFGHEETAFIRAAVQGVVKRELPENVTVLPGEGLEVDETEGGFTIRAESRSALARGFFRLSQEITYNRRPVRVREKRHIASCGPHVDMSRNGVFTLQAARQYMACCAALGMNMIMLYTEDTYTVPEYPYLGYLRGRFTPEEWREMDDYASRLGMELIPSIQTLAHLENFLQWRQSEPMQDQEDVVLIDSEDTYRFLEAAVASLRECVKTHTLNIGMDEAAWVGLGRYYKLHGPTDRFQLLQRHLKRVVAICEKYDFTPIMWSDMFFRLGSKTNAYYDMEAQIPQTVIDDLPRVELCYWDYYHRDEAWYDHMLIKHEKFGQGTSFAGGVWVWNGFLPHPGITRATMVPALKSCLKHGTKRVLATLWGDDGAECSPFLALYDMPLFSEAMWRGEVCSRQVLDETGTFLTGLSRRAYESFACFYPDDTDRREGKALVWCDLLYPLGPGEENLPAAAERARKALDILLKEDDSETIGYARALFEVCALKAEMILRLRALYRAGDRAGLAAFAGEKIHALIEAYDTLTNRHRVIWEQAYKRNGWEVLALRYGAVTGRLRDVKDALERYAAGTLDTLCELDEPILDPARKHSMQACRVYLSPVYQL